MSASLLLALPWIVAALALPWLIRTRPRLSGFPPVGDGAPFASIIVPARNEAANLGTCVGTLLASGYPAFEILIVDDRSTDGTAEIARELARTSPDRIRFIEGTALPDGWVGKCWACWQGYGEAKGDVLVFTDADTRHGKDLLGHAVAALDAEDAALVTGFPRQLVDGFWERLILPHIFTAIELRYRDPRRMNRGRNPRDAVANGQFLVFRRDAYEAVGGHRAVRGEIVEDIRLAQLIVGAKHRLFAAWAKDVIETRMYRSLRDIIEGWSKNLARGSRHSVDPWLRPLLPWLVALFQIGFWVAPPALLVASIAGAGVPLLWAATATGAALAFWLIRHIQFRAPVAYTLLFPFGALAVALLFLRSAWLGENVTWKGRRYGASSTNSTATRRGISPDS
jgi:chlorobactene glucosyltransferase